MMLEVYAIVDRPNLHIFHAMEARKKNLDFPIPFQADGSPWPFVRRRVEREHDWGLQYYSMLGDFTPEEPQAYRDEGIAGGSQPNLEPVHTFEKW